MTHTFLEYVDAYLIASLAACIPLQLLESGGENGRDHEVGSSMPGMISMHEEML